MADVKEREMVVEIRRLEARLDARHKKTVRVLEQRIDELEAIVGKLGAWVASRQRAEAQKKIDDNAKPVIHQRDETGELWLSKS